MESFDSARKRLEKQYEHVVYDPESGLDEEGIRPVAYEETEHCQITRAFLQNPQRMLRELLAQ